jgi:hypothetical protein
LTRLVIVVPGRYSVADQRFQTGLITDNAELMGLRAVLSRGIVKPV